MNIKTLKLIEDILYISLYDRTYNTIPDEHKNVVFNQIVEVLNYVTEEIGSKMPYIQYENINSILKSEDGKYGYVDVDFYNIHSVKSQTTSNKHLLLNYLPLDNFLVIAANNDFQGDTTYYTFDEYNRKLLLFPYNNLNITVFGNKLLPSFTHELTDNVHNFSPTEFELKNQSFFIEFLKLKCAKILCENNNTPFPEMRNQRLAFLEKTLNSKKQIDLRGGINVKKIRRLSDTIG